MPRKLFSLLLLLCGGLCLSGEAQQVAFEHQTGRIPGAERFSKESLGNLTKLKNGQGERDADANTWKKYQLHKDHWDATSPNGKKVNFEGNQIESDRLKNKI